MTLKFDKSKKEGKDLVLEENILIRIQNETYVYFMTNDWTSLEEKLKKLGYEKPAEKDFRENPSLHRNVRKKMTQLNAEWSVTATKDNDILNYYKADEDRAYIVFLNELNGKSAPLFKMFDYISGEETEKIKEYVELGHDIEQRFQGGLSFIIWAAFCNKCESLSTLIKFGADINASDLNGTTPLMHAAKRSPEAFQILLQAKGIKIDARDYRGDTALHVAANCGNAVEVKDLIKAGADVNAANLEGYTPLMAAANSGDVESIDLLIKAGASVNVVSKSGSTALSIAACCGYVDAVRLLIKEGANINEKNLLLNCIMLRQDEIASILIDAGADAGGSDEHSPLLISICLGSFSIAKRIIATGVRITANNRFQAVRATSFSSSYEILDFLLENGYVSDTDVQIVTAISVFRKTLNDTAFFIKASKDRHKSTLTAFCSLCSENKKENVKRISKFVDYINEFSFYDMTPLMCACFGEAKYTVKELIENGADVNLANKEGKTALMYAASRGNMAIIRYLIQSGANRDAKDKDGKTYQDYASNVDKRSFGDMVLGKYILKSPKTKKNQKDNVSMERQTFNEKFNWYKQKYFERYPKNKTSHIYRAANISKQTFSHIVSSRDSSYRPRKENVLSLAAGLKLSQKETEDLLQSAGYSFDEKDIRDMIVKESLSKRNCNVDDWDMEIFKKTGKGFLE